MRDGITNIEENLEGLRHAFAVVTYLSGEVIEILPHKRSLKVAYASIQ